MSRFRHLSRSRKFGWFLSILSLYFAILWLGSMRWRVRLAVTRSHCVSLVSGTLSHESFTPLNPSPRSWGRQSEFMWPQQWETQWWFRFATHTGTSHVYRIHAIPLWPLILATGIPGAWILITTPPQRRRCCGYPRDGLPPGAKCPECGME